VTGAPTPGPRRHRGRVVGGWNKEENDELAGGEREPVQNAGPHTVEPHLGVVGHKRARTQKDTLWIQALLLYSRVKQG